MTTENSAGNGQQQPPLYIRKDSVAVRYSFVCPGCGRERGPGRTAQTRAGGPVWRLQTDVVHGERGGWGKGGPELKRFAAPAPGRFRPIRDAGPPFHPE